MRILIAGAGALGSVFGGFLRKAGHQVTLFGRVWHLDEIREKGLRIEGIWGSHNVGNFILATSPDKLTEPYDLILVTVKSYDTETMAWKLAPFVKNGSLTVSLQNGLGNTEILSSVLGADNVVSGRVIFGAEITEPGLVNVTVIADDVVLGPPVKGAKIPEPDKITAIVGLLLGAGIPCRYDENIQGLIWAKAFYNCALNPLGALFGMNYGQLADNQNARLVMEQVVSEAFQVALSRKIALPWNSPEKFFKAFYEEMVPPTRNHRPSMLQDLERGRLTEIDALNGRILSWAQEAGLSVPVNETITRLIKIKEKFTV
ncbi:MAG: 2-dehydropantoate 2-reductase [Desulfotomaculum sp. 46_80]|nr:MAG: 2-dehydropantoate 2-reductase [Desulfotomaculum sp. 46_80]HAU32724.1 2-dehydropantoate 2-reductase [Desulfotomaculum sp.]